MSLRFRKSFKKGPLRTTVTKNGIGYSLGIPGFRVGISPTSRYYISLGLPGTGLYWIKYFGQSRVQDDQERIESEATTLRELEY
jgi:hypothetical protein